MIFVFMELKKHKLHLRTKRKCPKCKSRFGVFLSPNLYKDKSSVICFYANCNWSMSIAEWNKKYIRSKFIDPGFKQL